MSNLDKRDGMASSKSPRSDNPYYEYDDPRFGREAHCIYFYYVSPSRDISAYYWDNLKPVDITRLIELSTGLAQLAVSSNVPLPPQGTRFNAFKWRRRSYIAIAIDDPNWNFPKPAIKMLTNNPSLYNSDHTKITIKDSEGVSREIPLFYCLNHIKKHRNNSYDLGKDDQYIKFEILRTEPPIEALYADGTNLGPPVPPPSGGKVRFPFNKFPLSLLIALLKWLNSRLGI